MNTRFAIRFLSNIRHPERSEANRFLSQGRPRPSAVEGPRHLSLERPHRNRFAYAGQVPPAPRHNVFRYAWAPGGARRSFDFGSARATGKYVSARLRSG